MANEKINANQWLEKKLPLQDRLTKASTNLVEKILQEENIEYLSISGRTKNKDSAREKIRRKSYHDLESQLTDLSGVRIIVFFESQVQQVSEKLKEIFVIDHKNSLDRDSVLGEDRIGYRSVHFVCMLGDIRKDLPEYASITDLKVEIQVRTVLQHAWAELAHDGSYKFSGELPKKIKRQLNLYSGMLELVDQGFDDISKEIDTYKSEIDRTPISEIEELEIDSINVKKYIEELVKKNKIKTEIELGLIDTHIINELKRFGVKTIHDLSRIFSKELIELHNTSYSETTDAGLLRDAMIFNDIDKYFEECWPELKWTSMDIETVSFISEKYGPDKVDEILDHQDIVLEP